MPLAPPKSPMAPSVAAKRKLTDDQKQELREAFDLFDQEQTGLIDYHQLKVAIRALGFEIKKAEVLQLMDEHDPTGRGTIDYDAFVDIMALRIAARSPEEEMHKAFLLFAEDVGADGTKRISLKNMKEIAKELGENLTSDDLQAMIAEFDTDADGKISFEEFRAIMQSSSLYE